MAEKTRRLNKLENTARVVEEPLMIIWFEWNQPGELPLPDSEQVVTVIFHGRSEQMTLEKAAKYGK